MSKIAKDLTDTHIAVSNLVANTSKDDVDNLLKSLTAIKAEVLLLRKNPRLYNKSRLWKEFGLCHNLSQPDCDYSSTLKLLRSLYMLWPKYSGNSPYPIKDSAGLHYSTCQDMYGLTKETVNSYTKSRMGLLNWCISMLDCYKGYSK
jgi:hypothetical protein